MIAQISGGGAIAVLAVIGVLSFRLGIFALPILIITAMLAAHIAEWSGF